MRGKRRPRILTLTAGTHFTLSLPFLASSSTSSFHLQPHCISFTFTDNLFYTFPPCNFFPSFLSHTVPHLHLLETYFALSLPFLSSSSFSSFLSNTAFYLHLQRTYFTFSLPVLSFLLSSVILYLIYIYRLLILHFPFPSFPLPRPLPSFLRSFYISHLHLLGLPFTLSSPSLSHAYPPLSFLSILSGSSSSPASCYCQRLHRTNSLY